LTRIFKNCSNLFSLVLIHYSYIHMLNSLKEKASNVTLTARDVTQDDSNHGSNLSSECQTYELFLDLINYLHIVLLFGRSTKKV
jgi:hypothetical protein